MAAFYSYKEYMQEHYGLPLYRIPVDMGMGCPHRNRNNGGCTFCPEDGARAIQTGNADTLSEQVEAAVHFAKHRYGAKAFLAYAQTFTGTNASVPEIREIYSRLLAEHDFRAISIGTRPDCLSEDMLDYLEELNRTLEVWIELGVQTIHDETLRTINRDHTWADSEKAIHLLKERGLKVAVHVILGLPGEGSDEFRRTAEVLAALPLDGIKIHNLHIIKNTQLADEYAANPFHLFNEYEYAEHVIDFLQRLPSDLPIMRISTDTPEEELIAPKWSMKKGQFLSYVLEQMHFRQVSQGRLFNTQEDEIDDTFEAVQTQDGSITSWNSHFKEHYHSAVGAHTEAVEKYIKPSGLADKLEQQEVAILDVCFGLGYNSLCACNMAADLQSKHKLEICGLDIDRRVVGWAATEYCPDAEDTFDWNRCLHSLYRDGGYESSGFSVQMKWGDARHTVENLGEQRFDLVFLDPFSTQRNAELWTQDFFLKLKAVMKPNALLLTYCAALPVRSGLLQSGFCVGETEPVGRIRSGTIASLDESLIKYPIPAEELQKIQDTSKGIPYRDPTGCASSRDILKAREKVVSEMRRG